MNLTIDRAPALAALQRVVGVVNRKHSIEILSNIVVMAEGGGLSLRGTDLDMEIIETVPAQVSETGATTLPADKLFDIVRNADPGAQITLKMGEGETRAEVRSGRSRFSVPALDVESFPKFPHEGYDGEFTMSAKTLADMLSRVSFLVGKGDADRNRVTSCIYLAPHGDELHAVGASSFGVALRREAKPEGAELRALLPLRLSSQIVKLLADREGDVKIAWTGGEVESAAARMIRVQAGETILTAKLFDALAYVDYMKVLVEERELSATTDQDALASALRRVAIMATSDSKAVRLAFTEGGVSASSVNAVVGEVEDEFAAEYVGPEVGFLISPNVITETLSSLNGDGIEIAFQEANREDDVDTVKVLLRAPSDPGFLAMLMKRRA